MRSKWRVKGVAIGERNGDGGAMVFCIAGTGKFSCTQWIGTGKHDAEDQFGRPAGGFPDDDCGKFSGHLYRERKWAGCTGGGDLTGGTGQCPDDGISLRGGRERV